MLDATRRGAALWALAALLVLLWPGPGRGQVDSLVGTRVVPRGGAMLRREDGRFVDANLGHHIYRVEQVSGEWILLASGAEKGWAKPADVLPVAGAMDYYTAELREHPDAAWAYVMRGLLWEELKEPSIALADYNEAIRLDPKDALAYLRRGVIRERHKRDLDRAVADYDEAIRLDPKLAKAFDHRAHARQVGHEDDLAIADYTEALRLDPKDPIAYHGRAIAWQARGNSDRALIDYDVLIQLTPNDPVALLNRGNLWADRKDYDKAVADYSEAIKLNKNYGAAYNNRGIVYRAKKDYDRALSDHNVALRINPRDPAALLDRGIVWKKLGEIDRALEDYDQAARIDPECAEAYCGRAWIQATCPAERFRDGKRAYEAAVRASELTDWKNPNHLDTLAAAYAECRDFKRAVEWQNKAIERADDSQKEAFHARLQLYQAKKSYRDETVRPVEPEVVQASSPAVEAPDSSVIPADLELPK